MRYATIALASIFTLALIMPAYAETYNVSINANSNTNACIPDCLSPQVIQINSGDKITWTNSEYCDEADESTWPACSRGYSLVSGNPVDGMDGQWDTGTISPGQTRSITFNMDGRYDYYDPGHKWIQGSITVGVKIVEKEVEVTKAVEVITENGTGYWTTVTETEVQTVEIINPQFTQRPDRPVISDQLLESLYPNRIDDIRQMINIGLNVDADNVHTINYIFHTNIGNSQIVEVGDPDGSDNKLGFSFIERVSETIILKMSNDLIGETLSVVDQDGGLLDYRYSEHDNFSIVEIDLDDTRTITLLATYVVPEYLDIAILGAVIASIIGVSMYIKYRQPKLTIIN